MSNTIVTGATFDIDGSSQLVAALPGPMSAD
jgi:hypothetical protein